MALALALPAAGMASAETLEQALATIVERHPQVQAARKAMEAAERGVDEAFAAYLPRLTARGDAGPERTDSPSRRATGQEPFNAAANRSTLTLTQNLFDGGRRDAGHEAAQFSREVAGHAYNATLQGTLFEGISAYHDVLRNARLSDLARTNEATIRRQLELEDERVRRGSGVGVDVLLAKARLQLAKEQRVAFEGRLRDARSVFSQVFDRPPVAEEMVEPVPPSRLLPAQLDQAIAVAVGENPQVLSRDRQVDVAKREVSAATSDYYPRLDLVGRLNYEDEVDGVPGVRHDQGVFLQVTWELFSGFSTQARRAQALARHGERLQNLGHAKRKIMEEVRLAWSALETARERVELLANAVNIAGEVFDARRRLRETARESAINVLDAETELYQARINFVNASYDARVASYRVLVAMGRLTPELLELPTTGQ